MKYNINQGHLRTENYINAEWINDILKKDTHFQEMINFASDKNSISHTLNLGISISSKAKNIIFVGIGGSTLGGKAFYNLFPDNSKNSIFFIDNLDKYLMDSVIKNIVIEDSYFVIISKSGETIETLTQLCYVIDTVEDVGLKPHDKCIILTKKSDNSMEEIAKKFNIDLIEWSGDISGRFSIFSQNINLINSIIGMNVHKICEKFIEITKNLDTYIDFFNFSISSLKNNISNNILMAYSDKMKLFIEWYIQLWSESLGKNGIGTNPCSAIGSVDQHSKLQLFLDGPKDKIFTIIGAKVKDKSTQINWSKYKDCKGLEKFKNANIDQIFSACYKGIIKALENKNLPVRSIEVQNWDEESISHLASLFIMETIICSHYFNINPYNQPEVEKSKINIFDNL